MILLDSAIIARLLSSNNENKHNFDKIYIYTIYVCVCVYLKIIYYIYHTYYIKI